MIIQLSLLLIFFPLFVFILFYSPFAFYSSLLTEISYTYYTISIVSPGAFPWWGLPT
jgi:hypothetical protein